MTLNLTDSLISIQQQQLTSKRSVPTQINFNFTESNLKAISARRQNLKRLQLSSELLAELRYYILLHSASLNSLTFITYYIQQQQKIAVIKTVISLQGKISQQLCRNFLNNPQLLKDLVINHYWLIENIGARIPFPYYNKTFLLTLILSLILTLIIVPSIFYFLDLGLPIQIIILIVFFLLLYWTIRLILKKYLTYFILRQLLFGFLSHNKARRSLGITLLRYFG